MASRSAGPSLSRRRCADLRRQLWPAMCIGAILTVLAGFGALVLSNAVYLGIDDAMVLLPRERLWTRVGLTLGTSLASTILALCVGIPVGYGLSRLKLPWPRVAATLVDLPIMVPPAAVGVFLFGVVKSQPIAGLIDFLGLRFAHDPAGVILVQFTVTVAFCARLMKASFDAVNPRFEDVSRSLGASLPRTFRLVTLPLAKNGILASALIVWARAAAEWEGLMLFVGGTMGKTDVLPFSVYLDWNGGLMGEVVTYSLVSVVLAVATMACVQWIGGRGHVW